MGNTKGVAQGETQSVLPAETLYPNRMVTVKSDGVHLTAADELPSGAVFESYTVAAAEPATIYNRRPGDKALLEKASAATLVVDDFFKSAANGQATPDGTSGSTAQSDATVGRVLEIRGSLYWCEYI